MVSKSPSDAVHFGLTLQSVDPPEEFRQRVREVEAGGFSHLWLTDSSLHARDCYSYLTLAAIESRTLRLGTAVTHPHSRHPAVNLVAITTVDELSGGRAIYGIGSGDRPVTELGLRSAKVQVVRQMVETSRQLLAGETLDWTGEAFSFRDAQLRFYRRADLPIYLAASGPKMLGLVGEIADGGLVLAGQFSESLSYVFQNVARGVEQAQRDLSEVQLFFMLYGSLGSDRRQAVEESRAMAAWFCQTVPQYVEMAGFDRELIERVRAAYSGGEFHHAREAAKLCPDDMVDLFTLSGTPQDAVARIERLLQLGARAFNFFPIGPDRWESIRLFAENVIPAFC
jgi:5,10-methylenetetrahydromethanopterin reductase